MSETKHQGYIFTTDSLFFAPTDTLYFHNGFDKVARRTVGFIIFKTPQSSTDVFEQFATSCVLLEPLDLDAVGKILKLNKIKNTYK